MVIVEVVRGDFSGDAREIRQQHAQTNDQARGSLHVERAQALETGERESDAEQWDAERPRAQKFPQLFSQPVTERSGQRKRQ